MMSGKKVVVWGTGQSAREFLDWYHRQSGELFHIAFFVDSDERKTGIQFNGKDVKSIESITDWDEYFVIIAIAAYRQAEWNEIAHQKGFWPNSIHYYRLVMRQPSELFKETMEEENQYKISSCCKINDLRILENGDIIPCCGSRVILGNVFLDSIEDVWGSVLHKIFRLSILNSTYSFCDNLNCSFIFAREKNKDRKNEGEKIIDHLPDHPQMLVLENDRICNLACASCRQEYVLKQNDVSEALCEVLTRGGGIY